MERSAQAHLAIRAMSAGIQNLLFTDVRSAEDARECVRIVRPETPEVGGTHGAAGGRAVGAGGGGGLSQVIQSYQDAVVVLMIEKKGAIENLEAILRVEGVDMVQFGPSDYSMSIGVAGQRDHPAVLEARNHTIKTALAMGVHPRAEINDARQAEEYLALGVKHFCLGTDVGVLFNWYNQQGGAMRELLGGGA
jgi:4-hydroxy-2-oxoheptanedioate aldolase